MRIKLNPRKINNEDIHDIFYLPSFVIKDRFTVKEFKLLLSIEIYHDGLGGQLWLLLNEFIETEDYLYCAAIKHYLDKHTT